MTTEIAKPRVFKFTGRGNFTLILKKSYTKPLTDVDGRVLTSQYVPALKAEFNNGYWETKDKAAVALIQTHAGWGSDFYWCADEPEAKGNEEIAKNIDTEKVARAKYMKKARRRRIENGPAQD